MATTVKRYTAEDLWAMPGDEPWELWDGKLHKVPGAGALANSLAGWIGMLVSQYVRPRRLGLVTGPDGGYVAFVEELPGANSQGDTLEEARSNLREAVQLVLEANRSIAKEALGDTSVIREPLAQIS